jgi:thioredoxin-related protein
MDAVTYPDPRIVDFVNRSCIPLRVSTSSSSPLPAQFRIQYTPTLVLVDGDGKEHDRMVGFVRPEEFIPSVSLSIGKGLFNKGQCERAISFFDKIVAEYPHSQSAQPAKDLKAACLRTASSS